MTTLLPTIAMIQRAVAAHYGITLAEMKGPSRKRRYAHPRQVAMSLAFRLTDHSKARIASFFDKSPNSAFNAIDAIERRQARSPKVSADLRRITLELVRR